MYKKFRLNPLFDKGSAYAFKSISMKLSLALPLLFVASLQARSNSFGQSITLNRKNVKIQVILKEIQKQSGYSILYNSALIPSKKIDIHIANEKVDLALYKILADFNIGFNVVDKNIILVPLKSQTSTIFSRNEDIRQEKLISGTIVDDKNLPLSRVSVTEKATGHQTVSDENGHFEIKVNNSKVTLLFSALGFQRKEVYIDGEKPIKVQLIPALTAIDEVVVVGYGQQKKANLTGAVDKISSDRLERFKATNLGESLAGQVPSLNINFSDGKPGRGASFNIRGTTSINGGSPLVLLDGVPISSFELNNISPQTIDNISFLKDASSAAIYGARAAYGVILVTTKEGKEGKTEVNYNNNFKWGKATKIPKVYTGTDYLEIQEKEFNGNIGQTYYTSPQVQYPYDVANDPSLPKYDLKTIGGKATLLLGGPVINYYDEWFKDYSPSQNHNLSVRGGGSKLKFYLSGDYNRQEGSLKFKPDQINRYNLRNNNTFAVSDKVSIFTKSSLTIRNDNVPNTYLYGFSSNPWRFIDNTNPLMPETVMVDGKAVPTDIGFYRQFIEKQSDDRLNTKSFLNSIGTDANLLNDELKLHADFSYLYYQWYRNRWWDNTGPYLSHSFNNRNVVLASYADAGPPKVYKSNTQSDLYNVNAYANYRKAFGKHKIDLTSGMTFESYRYHYETVEHQNPIVGLDEHAINLATGLFQGSDDDDKYANRSFFLRANYNFNEKYLLEINGMHNTTSKFRKENRGAFFGSISGGWRISEEDFFAPLKNTINNLKLRGSFGSLGNQNIGSFDYLSIMSMTRSPYLLDGEQYTYTSVPAPKSENFTWETSKSVDVGLDANFFNNKLELVADWYQRNTNNMLAPYHSLPSVFGATVPKENIASLRNRGWELSLAWNDRIGSVNPFEYGIRFNISDYRAFITDYYNPTNYLGDLYIGKEMGEIWGLNTLGFFQSDEEAKNSALLKTSSYKQFASKGTIKFEDSNQDGEISKGAWTLNDPGDYRIIGNSTPRYQYGINLNMRYQGFDMAAFFKGIGKRDIYPSAETANFWSSYNRKYQVLLEHVVKDRWTEDNPNAYFPKPQGYIALGENDLGVAQTRYLQNASFLRLSNLIIGYTFPKKTFNNKINNLRVYLAATNLMEWTKLHNTLDPEGLDKDPDANAASVGMGTAYPIQRTFSFGLELGF